MQGRQTIAKSAPRTKQARHSAATASESRVGWVSESVTKPARSFPAINIRWVAIAVVLLGISVRCRHYLAAPSYWYDEAYVLVNIFDKSLAELAGPLRCEQAAPPAFLWTLRLLYETFGRSEWAMRAPAFLASVLSIILMIPLSRRIVGAWAGWWPVGLLALSQTAIFHTVCVKPYSGDLLATTIVLLLAAIVLAAELRERRWAWAGLFAAAAILPWASYPSVFSLAAATLALALQALSRRRESSQSLLRSIGSRLLSPILFALLWTLSFATVWLLIGRVQHSHVLADYWQPFFLDRSSPGATLASIGHTFLMLGHYGTTGMQLPIVVLAGYGAWRMFRSSLGHFVLVAGPLVLMFVASAASFYPLEDRLFYFALPCLWLLAATGIDGILRFDWRRWRPVIVFLLAAPLIPGAVRYVYWLAVVPDKVEYRQAFEYVQEHQQAGDARWVSHPEVFEVYFGKGEKCNSLPSADQRAWLILARGCDEQETIAKMGCQFRQAIDRQDMQTVSILLFDAANNTQSKSPD